MILTELDGISELLDGDMEVVTKIFHQHNASSIETSSDAANNEHASLDHSATGPIGTSFSTGTPARVAATIARAPSDQGIESLCARARSTRGRDPPASRQALATANSMNQVGKALRTAKGIQSGVISVNSNSSVHREAPFGGYKMSGVGRELGMAAIELYTETDRKSIRLNSSHRT